MVRQVPFSRRFRSWRGTLVNVAVWMCAASASMVLLVRSEMASNAIVLASGATASVVVPADAAIVAVQVKVGDRVEAGAPLMRLSIPGLDQQIAALENQIASAGTAFSADDVERESRLRRDAERARADLAAARVAYAQERALLIGKEQVLERMMTQGVGEAQALVDVARSERDALKASVDARLVEISALERAASGAQQRAGLDLDTAGTNLAALEADLALLRGQQEACTLRAPVAGIVTGAAVSAREPQYVGAGSLGAVGQWLRAGTVVATISTSSTAEATAWVPAVALSRVEPGETVNLVRADGTRVPASVRAVGGAVEVVPAQAQLDPLVPEWKVPVILDAAAAVMVPGERLTTAF